MSHNTWTGHGLVHTTLHSKGDQKTFPPTKNSPIHARHVQNLPMHMTGSVPGDLESDTGDSGGKEKGKRMGKEQWLNSIAKQHHYNQQASYISANMAPIPGK